LSYVRATRLFYPCGRRRAFLWQPGLARENCQKTCDSCRNFHFWAAHRFVSAVL